ncbi:TnsD family Tn7-like transposition protein [Brevibacillus nitrificans]|uniref:TnsD family Tn7-like transposition protein n=1 Tax=Brevibacillus nitrificans TaxID=651560 RepID=UPI0016056A78|nr:TnsD family Tn7-like transposition protein [Brevibacillus nitrificans]
MIELLPFFPTPYPDELLYSMFARYHEWSQNPEEMHTYFDLFGNRATPTVHFPNRLNDFCKRLSTDTLLTPEKLINEHTIFPVYRPFLSKERSEKVHQLMMSSKSANILAVFGLTAIKICPYLRYCPTCVQKDEHQYGEAYWHREHQIYPIRVCPRDKTILVESNVHASSKINGKKLLTLQNYLQQHPYISAIETSDNAIEYQISVDISWLLQNYNHQLNINDLYYRYVEELKALGLANSKGTVTRKELFYQFKETYSEEFLNRYSCNLQHSRKYTWLDSMIKKHMNRFVIPIRHVLLIRFLGYWLSQFFSKKDHDYLPYGSPPYPCLNIASPHYGEELIDSYNSIDSGNRKIKTGIFACQSCGFVYAKYSNGNREKSEFDYVHTYGTLWEDKLLELRRNGHTIKEICDLLSTSESTVYRRLGMVKDRPVNRSENFLIKRDEIRSKWLSKLTNANEETINQMRAVLHYEYSWLRKYDQHWLENNSAPAQRYIRNEKIRREYKWEEIDQQLVTEIPAVVNEILNDNFNFVRVTKEAIGRKINKIHYITVQLDKLPKTKAVVELSLETIEDYHVRKISGIAQNMREREEKVTASKLISKTIKNKKHLTERIQRIVKYEVQKSLFDTEQLILEVF